MALAVLDSSWRPDIIPVALGALLVFLVWRSAARNKEVEVPLLTDASNDFHKIMNEGYSRVSLMLNSVVLSFDSKTLSDANIAPIEA